MAWNFKNPWAENIWASPEEQSKVLANEWGEQLDNNKQTTEIVNIRYMKYVGIKLYTKYRSGAPYMNTPKSAWSILGSAFGLAQSAIESGYGIEGPKEKSGTYEYFKSKNNFWGHKYKKEVIRYDSFDKGFITHLDNLALKWPDALKLFEKQSFTPDDADHALWSGPYKNTEGKYSYSVDKEYSQVIFNGVMPGAVKRAIIAIDEEIDRMNAEKETQKNNIALEYSIKLYELSKKELSSLSL